MARLRRILCPTDFSPASQRALEHATGLARWAGATIEALLVRPPVASLWSEPPTVDLGSPQPRTDDAYRADLEAFVAPAQSAGVPTHTALAVGDPAREIVRRADLAAADLIVMATHGRTGLARALLGSVTESVLHRSSRAVLTVCRADHASPLQEPPFQRLLCPVDFSPPSIGALRHALVLADQMHATLTALHVFEPAHESPDAPPVHTRLRQLVPLPTTDRLRVLEVPGYSRPGRRIVRVAKDDGADLIVMSRHGHRMLGRMIFGSATEDVVRHATCPVLTIPAEISVGAATNHERYELAMS